MGTLKIKRLYVENYKLFSAKTIEFDGVLTVFDGPNGYGKTSIFDALEFLITGTIERVISCASISGLKAYASNFLAHDSSKDIIIKGEFCTVSEDRSVIIAKRITANPASGHNPKKLEEQAQTFLLPKFECPIEEWSQYQIPADKVYRLPAEIFGINASSQFILANYIQQENRLSFFNQTEKDRTTAIQKLFGLEAEQNKSNNISDAARQLKKKLQTIETHIAELTKNLQSANKSQMPAVPYEQLTDGPEAWDVDQLPFNGKASEELYENFVRQVTMLREFLLRKEQFLKSQPLKAFVTQTQVEQRLTLLAFLFDQKSERAYQQLDLLKKQRAFLSKQYQLATDGNYIDIDYKTLTQALHKQNQLDAFTSLVYQAQTIRQNQSDLQKVISDIMRTREQLHSSLQNSQSITPESSCPYCGQTWKSRDELQQHFADTTVILKETFGRENSLYSDTIGKLHSLFNQELNNVLVARSNELDRMVELQIYMLYSGHNDLAMRAKQAQSLFQAAHLHVSAFQWRETAEMCLQETDIYSEAIVTAYNAIPSEYTEADEKYRFEAIFEKIFRGDLTRIRINIQQVENKLLYLQQQYYQAYDADRMALQKLQATQAVIQILHAKMSEYDKAYKKAISSYRELVVKQIEIPFFLYTSRILQSYQGGQGILMQTNGDSIRFTSPGSEHDILYTMSSGQLSAILLSFSLAINKIYATGQFKTLLIDDPIQCMDDINMISFIEVIRCDFKDVQVILSTHEDLFANYIIYKYEKYNLTGKTISLRDA